MTYEDRMTRLDDQHAVDALLAEAGCPGDEGLRELLLQLRSFRTDEVPPPSPEVAALLAADRAAPLARLDPRQPRRKRCFVFTSLGVAASLGIAGGAAAVNGDLRREAEGTVSSILRSFAPPVPAAPAPAPAPTAPTRPDAVVPSPAGEAPAATIPPAPLPVDPALPSVPEPAADLREATPDPSEVMGPPVDVPVPARGGEAPAARPTEAPRQAFEQSAPGNAEGAAGGQAGSKAGSAGQDAGAATAETHGPGENPRH